MTKTIAPLDAQALHKYLMSVDFDSDLKVDDPQIDRFVALFSRAVEWLSAQQSITYLLPNDSVGLHEWEHGSRSLSIYAPELAEYPYKVGDRVKVVSSLIQPIDPIWEETVIDVERASERVELIFGPLYGPQPINLFGGGS